MRRRRTGHYDQTDNFFVCVGHKDILTQFPAATKQHQRAHVHDAVGVSVLGSRNKGRIGLSTETSALARISRRTIWMWPRQHAASRGRLSCVRGSTPMALLDQGPHTQHAEQPLAQRPAQVSHNCLPLSERMHLWACIAAVRAPAAW